MNIAALVTGEIFRQAEQRTAKSGRPYTVATIKARDGDASVFVRITAFSDTTQDELLRLSAGDAVSAQGVLRAEAYTKDGEARVGLSVVASAVLPLRAERKQKEKPADNHDRPAQRHALDRHGGGDPAFDDEIPF